MYYYDVYLEMHSLSWIMFAQARQSCPQQRAKRNVKERKQILTLGTIRVEGFESEIPLICTSSDR